MCSHKSINKNAKRSPSGQLAIIILLFSTIINIIYSEFLLRMYIGN